MIQTTQKRLSEKHSFYFGKIPYLTLCYHKTQKHPLYIFFLKKYIKLVFGQTSFKFLIK